MRVVCVHACCMCVCVHACCVCVHACVCVCVCVCTPQNVNELNQWLSAIRKLSIYNERLLPSFHPGAYRSAKWTCCLQPERTGVCVYTGVCVCVCVCVCVFVFTQVCVVSKLEGPEVFVHIFTHLPVGCMCRITTLHISHTLSLTSSLSLTLSLSLSHTHTLSLSPSFFLYMT